MAAAPRLPLFDLTRDRQRAWLTERLGRPAPPAAQGLSDGFRLPGREGEPIPAAVLVPLVNRPQGLQLLLTQRSASLADHPGQISFPGGRLDPGDVDHAAAALRETREEIGLSPAKIDVLGHLSPYETVTGYRVLPQFDCLVYRRGANPYALELCVDRSGRLVEAIDRRTSARHYPTLRSQPSESPLRVDRSEVDRLLRRMGASKQ